MSTWKKVDYSVQIISKQGGQLAGHIWPATALLVARGSIQD